MAYCPPPPETYDAHWEPRISIGKRKYSILFLCCDWHIFLYPWVSQEPWSCLGRVILAESRVSISSLSRACPFFLLASLILKVFQVVGCLGPPGDRKQAYLSSRVLVLIGLSVTIQNRCWKTVAPLSHLWFFCIVIMNLKPNTCCWFSKCMFVCMCNEGYDPYVFA